MKCEEVRDEMIAYLKDEMDVQRKIEISEHVVRCQGCQRELDVARRVFSQTQAAEDSSIIRFVNTIFKDAIDAGATDMHIDPTHEGAEVRLRIDGVLHSAKQLSVEQRDVVLARIKLMAALPFTESGAPLDGRIPIRMDGRDYDFRVSIMPVVTGEKIEIRILDRGVPLLGLDNLGFYPEQLELVKNLLHQPAGMVVSTGPAGSGKTTLLYSMILELTDPSISIVTVEDPVEYLLPGVQQTQVNWRTGLTFAVAIRTYLRQDPDVIMVGELRDAESTILAAHAAMTGHLVLGNMLISDAVSIPHNMVAYGVDPWIVGRSLAGVIACVLVRKVCQDCKEEYTPSDEALEFLGLKDQVNKTKFYRGTGCDKCRNVGYQGRAQLHEILAIDRELSKMISNGPTDPDAVLKHAVGKGFIPMEEVARRKILDGITTAEEAYRVLSWR